MEVTLNDLCSFMGMSSLSRIIIHDIDSASIVSKPEYTSMPHSTLHRGAMLSLLDLGRAHIPPLELCKALKLASSITKLRCAMPGVEKVKDRRMIGRPMRVSMASPLSPAMIVQAFSPLQSSLTNLHLNHETFTMWPSHDGTRLDMSNFICMKILEVPSTCFFEASPKQQRNSVTPLLPPSLEKLSVCTLYSKYSTSLLMRTILLLALV